MQRLQQAPAIVKGRTRHRPAQLTVWDRRKHRKRCIDRTWKFDGGTEAMWMRGHYPAEKRAQLVELVMSTGTSIAAAAAELGVQIRRASCRLVARSAQPLRMGPRAAIRKARGEARMHAISSLASLWRDRLAVRCRGA